MTSPGNISNAAASQVEIRQLVAADALRYRTLMLDAYERFSEAFTSTADERRTKPVAWWEKRIADPEGNSVAFGAFVDGEMVGSAGLEFETRDKTRHKSLLIGMLVLPEQRRRGLGHALVNAALDHARSRPGAVVMRLALTGGNTSAQKLYESCGFSVFGIEPMGLCIDGGYRDKVHMWRPIAS